MTTTFRGSNIRCPGPFSRRGFMCMGLAGFGTLRRGAFFRLSLRSSLSRTFLQRMTQLSQMYTPGP